MNFRVPAGVGENFIDDAVQVRIDGVHQANTLLDVLIKDLNMPRLVKGSARRHTIWHRRSARRSRADWPLIRRPARHGGTETDSTRSCAAKIRRAPCRSALSKVRIVVQIHELSLPRLFGPRAIPVDIDLRIPI